MWVAGVSLMVGALLVGMVAVVDHHEKQARLERAEVLAWYCTHRDTRCGGPSSKRIEARWNKRQLAYEWVVALLGGGGLTCVALQLLRPRMRR